MKKLIVLEKLIVLVGFLLIGTSLYSPVKAATSACDTACGFPDGKFYDVNGVLKYNCFLNGDCYDLFMNPAPFKIVPISFTQPVSPVDVCANIEGSQSVTPVGLVNENGNCVVPAPVVSGPAPQVVTDATAPQLVGMEYYGCISDSCGIKGGISGLTQSQESRVIHSGLASGEETLTFVTSEPATAKMLYFPNPDAINPYLLVQNLPTPITFTDSNFDTIHNLKYSDIGLQKNMHYYLEFELTDSSGNKSVLKYPDYSYTLFWK